MAACESAIDQNTPRRMRYRAIFEKKFSTALPGGRGRGECKVQRGWRASQAGTLGCLWVAQLSRRTWIGLSAATSPRRC
jgi:hypothetical protein